MSLVLGQPSGLALTTKKIEPKLEEEVEPKSEGEVVPTPKEEVEGTPMEEVEHTPKEDVEHTPKEEVEPKPKEVEPKPKEEVKPKAKVVVEPRPEEELKPLPDGLSSEALKVEVPDLPTSSMESREPSSDAEVLKPELLTEEIPEKVEQEKPEHSNTSRQSPITIPEKEEAPRLPSTKSLQSSVPEEDSESDGSLVDSSFSTVPKEVIPPPPPQKPTSINSINVDCSSVVSDLESPYLLSGKVVVKKEAPRPSWSPALLPTNSLMTKTNNLTKRDRRKIVRESVMTSTRGHGRIAESEEMPTNI